MKKILLTILLTWCIASVATKAQTEFTITAAAPTPSSKKALAKGEKMLNIYAEIRDHLTHDPVKVTKAELLWAADSTFADSIQTVYDTSYGLSYSRLRISVTEAGEYLIKICAEGYQTRYEPLEIKKMHKREQYRELNPIYLRKEKKQQAIGLDEVVVTATKLKFYMDGDTLVYDADAFSMAEGSMLNELIKKLPGVTLESNGIIKVNGRRIDALLLNGKDFFDEDRELLLENMPSYMVKHIQSYERVPEALKGTARENTARKELVMNVKLKKEYAKGWIANAELGGGSTLFKNNQGDYNTKFLGRLFGLQFTDNSRLTLFANANNLNNNDTPDEYGEAALTQSEGLMTTYKFGGNYLTDKEDKYRYQGGIEGTYTDAEHASSSSGVEFLENGDIFTRFFHTQREYNWDLESRHQLTLMHRENIADVIKNLYAFLSPSINYKKWNNHSASANVTLSEDMASLWGKDWMDSITAPQAGDVLKHHAINRTISNSKGKGDEMTIRTLGYFMFTPAYNDFVDFNIDIHHEYNKRENNSFTHYQLDHPASETLTPDFRNQYAHTRSHTNYLGITPQVSLSLDKNHKHRISASYSFNYNYRDTNQPLYLLNKLDEWGNEGNNGKIHPLGTLPSMEEMLLTLDANNSSDSKNTTYTHTPRINYTFNFGNSQNNIDNHIAIGLYMPMAHENLDYHRGNQVDTVMSRSTAFLNTNIMFSHSTSMTGRSISAGYNLSQSAPTMTSMLNIRDDRNPLYIKLGNPNLKNTKTHRFHIYYNDKIGEASFNANAESSITENAVASGYIYNKETGVRIVTPTNVNGNWEISSSVNIFSPLDANRKWNIKEEISYRYAQYVDMSGTGKNMTAIRSVATWNTIRNNMSLNWCPTEKMEYEILGDFSYQHSNSSHSYSSKTDAFTFQYGAKAKLELPWNLQISTYLSMYSRRGYNETSMNTDRLIWNARVSKRLPKLNMTIIFDGFDLLGNCSQARRTFNTQTLGYTETFYDFMPSYGVIRVIYRLNKQPKKKE